ncbi:hypothetical protein ACEQ8H_003150 [Pleosporales sp. CAS-2024a]
MLSNTILALSLLPLTLAHFVLESPTSRGFDDDKESSFPCGTFNNVMSNRTDFPISGGPIQLKMGHEQTNVAVYMAIGDNPGSAFNIVMRHTIMVTGLGEFCLGGVSVPAGVNVTDGTKATIQVVTNGDPSGGLYQCADVTLRTAPLSGASQCSNGTGVSVSQQNISGNPNATTSGSSGSSSSKSAASHVKAASWVVGAVGALALALL